jgi:glycosyltransferase involved in cell wall biosynthesis
MTWACGGIFAPFSQVNALVAQGHEAVVFAPKCSRADWFPLAAPLLPFPEDCTEQDRTFDAAVFVGDSFLTPGFIAAKRRFLLLQGKDHLWVTPGKRKELLRAYGDRQFHVLAVSNWLADFVRERCNNPQVTTVGNGVDTNRFFPAPEPREKFRLLIEGNMPDKNKNAIDALEVAGRVRHYQPVEVWAMARRFTSAGVLVDKIFLDPHPDAIAGIYQKCDILIKTSIMEGFGLPHLEAMACGCIPVTYASGGVTDFCKHGENSLVTGVGNIPAMVGHTLHLLSDTNLRAHLREGALATARSKSWGQVADILETTFTQEIKDCL